MKLELEWCGKPEDDYRTFLPVRKTPLSSGVDLKAYNAKPITIKPGTNALISTGWKIKIPEGHEAQIRSRSGMAYKQSVWVQNCPGTIDRDYQGELLVLLYNGSNENRVILRGMAVAQLVIAPVVLPEIVPVANEVLFEIPSVRKDGGFGSTGDY